MKKWQQVLRTDFVKHIATLFTGTAIAQAIPYLFSPVLSRIFTPAEFGSFGLYVSITSVLSIIGTGDYEHAIMLPRRRQHGFLVLALSILLNLTFALLLAIALVFAHSAVCQYFSDNQAYIYVIFIPLSVFILGLFRSLNFWNNRNKHYRNIAVANVSRASSMTGIQVGSGLLKMNTLGLIAGEIFGQIVRAVILVQRSWTDFRQFFRSISPKRLLVTGRIYANFPKFSMPSQLLNFFSTQIPVLLLPFFFTNAVVGMYFLPHKIMTIPLTMLGASISQVYFRNASRIKQRTESLSNLTFQIFEKLFFIGIVPFTLVAIYGNVLFAFVFGTEWYQAGIYAQLLSPWLFFVFIASPISIIFTVLDKLQLSLIFNLILVFLRLTALFIGGWMLNNALYAIFLYAAVGFCYWVFLTFFILRLAKVSYIRIFKRIGIIIPVAVIIYLSRIFFGI